jgi:hypothetical protein
VAGQRVYRAEDTPVVHKGIAIVPVRNEHGDNTWIELPADAWVVLLRRSAS